MSDKINVNGIEYIRADLVPVLPEGNRVVLVVDRGWIFAGDVTEENGRIYLDRAVQVFRWELIGFPAVIENPMQKGVDIRRMSTRVDVPVNAEVFRLPVHSEWGLK